MQRGHHYLFFAIRPDLKAAEQLHQYGAEARRRRSLTGRQVAPDHLHVSLNFVDKRARPDVQIIDRAVAAATTVTMPPFVLALDRIGTWGRGPGPKAIVAWADDGVIGARLLHTAIHTALAPTGLVPKAEPNLEPHLTLLRDISEATPEFIEPVKWTVREFVLLDSARGEGRHELLGRWPLRPAVSPSNTC